MAKLAIAAAAVATSVDAKSIALKWSDCGADHGKITDVEPTSLPEGALTPITGKGTIDMDLAAGTFNFNAKVLGISVLKGSGDVCSATHIDFPAGAGSIDFKGVNCPAKANTEVDLELDTTISSDVPTSLARVTIELTVADASGNSFVCAQIKTSPGSAWENYKEQFGKVYNGEDEDAQRHAIFEANLDYMEEENQKGHSYTLGINQFTDMTNEEYRATLGYKPSPLKSLPNLGVHDYEGEELAASVDWTTKGAVTPVKNQGQCGSCWAFSTTGGMEGAWEIASGKLVSLSEQQLVDCSKQNSGCNGGSMESAFSFEEGVNVCTESSYPYKAADGSCKSSCSTGIPRGGITGYKTVSRDSAQALQSAINKGPVSVAIEADQSSFQMYSGGILSASCGSNLDHGVLAVGYGSGYWLVKNSWGSSWGDNGYVKLSTTAGGSAGQCGILSDASYPTVSASVTV